jgi:hypothetical protein
VQLEDQVGFEGAISFLVEKPPGGAPDWIEGAIPSLVKYLSGFTA